MREDGAQGRDRTTDTVIFSHVLYQLSYLGAGPRVGTRACPGEVVTGSPTRTCATQNLEHVRSEGADML